MTGFSDIRKVATWVRGHPIDGYDATEWRRDDYGNVIRFSEYGNRDSPNGWEVDHIVAVALGGSDDFTNLRPLHCSTNAGLGGLLAAALKR